MSPTPNNALADSREAGKVLGVRRAQAIRAQAIRAEAEAIRRANTRTVVRTLPFRSVALNDEWLRSKEAGDKAVLAAVGVDSNMRRLAALIQDEIRAEAKVAFHKAKKRDDLYEHAYAKLVRIRDLIQAGMHPTYKRTQSEQVDPRWTRADYTALSKAFRT
jgi:hypothetical protein